MIIIEFDWKHEAEVELEARLKEVYAGIEARGDTVIKDFSRVIHPFFTNGDEAREKKWIAWVEVYTQEMIDDLKAMKGFDPGEELEAINAIKDKISPEITKHLMHLAIQNRTHDTSIQIP